MLPLGRWVRRLWTYYFSTPVADRPLHQPLAGKAIRSLVEIGVPDVRRTLRLWDLLAERPENLPLKYTGIDLFDARLSTQPPLPLKQAFAELRRDGIQVKLVPGDPQSALHRVANSLMGTDLLIVSANLDAASLAKAWTWMPRMLHAGTIIFQESAAADGQSTWQRLSIVEIQQRARSVKRAA